MKAVVIGLSLAFAGVIAAAPASAEVTKKVVIKHHGPVHKKVVIKHHGGPEKKVVIKKHIEG